MAVKVLALERELRSGEIPADLLKAEAKRAWELYMAGMVREAYFRADKHEAVLVMEGPDLARIEQAVESLPLVKAGLITFDLIPLKPYDGFSRLFGRE